MTEQAAAEPRKKLDDPSADMPRADDADRLLRKHAALEMLQRIIVYLLKPKRLLILSQRH